MNYLKAYLTIVMLLFVVACAKNSDNTPTYRLSDIASDSQTLATLEHSLEADYGVSFRGNYENQELVYFVIDQDMLQIFWGNNLDAVNKQKVKTMVAKYYNFALTYLSKYNCVYIVDPQDDTKKSYTESMSEQTAKFLYFKIKASQDFLNK